MKKPSGSLFVMLSVLCVLLLSGMLSCGDPSQIDCSYYTQPVCGLDGVTYQNDCAAEKAGEFTYMDGTCPPIVCSGPVCGSDGTSYLTSCFAVLSGITVYMTGECPFSPCSAGPVCGDDSVTYANDCLASLAGVATWTPGACP